MAELEQFNGFATHGPRPVYLQAADFLRERIACGVVEGGARLPSVRTLAECWKIKESTVARALRHLGAQGVLLCSPNVGNFVRERASGLTRVAIYSHLGRSNTGESDQFSRLLREALSVRLAKQNAVSEIFLDERSQKEQESPLPELTASIQSGRIQELIVLESTYTARVWLGKLGIPAVAFGGRGDFPCVNVDLAAMIAAACDQLAARGCHRPALISSHTPNRLEPWGVSIFEMFRDESARRGMAVDPAWIPISAGQLDFNGDQAWFGYRKMHELLTLPNPPDGVFLYPDSMAAGAVAALIEVRIPIPEKLKVSIHRNRQIALFAPFPCDVIEFDVEELADELIRRLNDQLQKRVSAAGRWKFRRLAIDPCNPKGKE